MIKLVMTLVLGISGAHAMSFEDFATNILQKGQSQFQKNEDIKLVGKTKNGHNCEAIIFNVTALNPNFPASSKDSQRIQVSVSVEDPSVRVPTANFRFDRRSEVIAHRSTPYILNLTVLNRPSGPVRPKMYQSLVINLSAANPKNAIIQVMDFNATPVGGNTLACGGFFQ